MKPKIYWLRKDDGNKTPVACVASTIGADGKIRYQVATHNPKDTFRRELGRKAAIKRLERRPYTSTLSPMLFGGSTKQALLMDIVNNEYLPLRTRNLAALKFLEARNATISASKTPSGNEQANAEETTIITIH